MLAADGFEDEHVTALQAKNLDALRGNIDARLFVAEAFRHCKTLGAAGAGVALLAAADLSDVKLATGSKELVDEQGVVTAVAGVKTNALVRLLIAALAKHRHWERAST